MPIVSEASNIEDFNACRASFAQTLPKNSSQRDFSDEQFPYTNGTSYFVAYSDTFELCGWMVTKSMPESVKIEGICTHTDQAKKKGALKSLVTRAVNISLKEGKRGTVTLMNSSSDGGAAYSFLGFMDTGNGTMRLEASNLPKPQWQETEQVPTKKGKRMWITELKSIA